MRLRPGLEVVWRRAGESQVGADPRCGVVLEGLSAPEQRLVEYLRSAPTQDDVVRRARALGIPPDRAAEILGLLSRAGVLDPRPLPAWEVTGAAADEAYWSRIAREPDGVLAARGSAAVAVQGLDRLGMTVAVTLAQAGVGTVLCTDRALVTTSDLGYFHLRDVGRPREGAARAILAGAFPHTRTADGPDVRPDVVVAVFPRVADPVRLRALVREDVPHLLVVVGEVSVTVGPLVTPGRGPCARCLDLHRTDADPCWPAVATQLRLAPALGAEAGTAQLASAVAARAVLGHLDGAPDEPGTMVEVDALQPQPVVHRWAVHPDCGCGSVGSAASTG